MSDKVIQRAVEQATYVVPLVRSGCTERERRVGFPRRSHRICAIPPRLPRSSLPFSGSNESPLGVGFDTDTHRP
eukprot:7476936-Pyramimonas_sp.AAC.2